jgi:hypothetical protein
MPAAPAQVGRGYPPHRFDDLVGRAAVTTSAVHHSLQSFLELRPAQVGRATYRTESISWSAGFQMAAFAPGLVFMTEKWSATNEPFDLTPIS